MHLNERLPLASTSAIQSFSHDFTLVASAGRILTDFQPRISRSLHCTSVLHCLLDARSGLCLANIDMKKFSCSLA